MATYYRWDKNSISFEDNVSTAYSSVINGSTRIYFSSQKPSLDSDGNYRFSDAVTTINDVSTTKYFYLGTSDYFAFSNPAKTIYRSKDMIYVHQNAAYSYSANPSNSPVDVYSGVEKYSFIEYVYSTSQSAYPNGGKSGGYYYSGRTTVTSPTAPSSLNYPAKIISSEVTVSWSSASSNTDYAVKAYELSYSINGGGSWVVYTTQTATSKPVLIPAGASSIQFRVRARDSNNQWGDYKTGSPSKISILTSITVPPIIMQGQSIPVSWTSVEEADSYILQRKADGGEWEQVYAGNDAAFTDAAGSWGTVQYQVCGVFDGVNGGFITSDPIPVVPASALVISGEDGDLGTITNDIPYSVSSDTATLINTSVSINGHQISSSFLKNGVLYKISVLDLPTGTGTIIISSTIKPSSGSVTVTRKWTYTKQAQSFPGSGGVAQLTKDGQDVFPLTLAEAVKAIGGPWGGDMAKALDKLAKAVVFNREAVPKYTEVKVDLSQLTTQDAKDGKIIMLPYQGRMVPHIVVQVGNPAPEMYDASCDGVWLLRKDISGTGKWSSNARLEGSEMMTTMAGYADDYDSAVQAAIKTVKIPYCVGDQAEVKTLESGLECKIFPLGAYELGFTTALPANIPVDGAKLDYFLPGDDTYAANIRRVSTFQGDPYTYYTRSSNTVFLDRAAGISGNANTSGESHFQGSIIKNATSGQIPGYRLTFLLPTTFQATYYVDQNGTVHPEQEYATAGDFSDLWGTIIPTVKVETGSYVGTGTYGVSNPTKITFSSRPAIVFILKESKTGWNYLITPLIQGSTFALVYISTSANYTLDVSWTDNTVSLVGSNGPTQQNDSGTKYNYVAVLV